MTTRYTRAELLQTNSFQTVRRPGLAGDLAGDYNIFTVTGVVTVSHCFGIITTVIAGAAVPFLQIATAVPVATVPLCALHASLDTLVSGIIIGWNGIDGTALTESAIGALDINAARTWAGGLIVLTEGVISVDNATPATGILDWYITYLPMSLDGEITIL